MTGGLMKRGNWDIEKHTLEEDTQGEDDHVTGVMHPQVKECQRLITKPRS